MTTEQSALYRAVADARIAGVACKIKLITEALPNGEVAGCVGLPDHHPEPLVGFVVHGDSKISFVDIPSDHEPALEQAFGISAVDLRGALCRLAVGMLLGPNAQTMPAEVRQPPVVPPGATVH